MPPHQVTCPSCGTPSATGSRYCAQCGARLSLPPLRLDGSESTERKYITVLFADLRGSLELIADRDPEEARELLDPVLELAIESVHEYGGTVNQVMGDGIMALFGAPRSEEDHALRACYAALRIHERLQHHHATLAGGVRLLMRIGINSGEVVVRSIRNDQHQDYTAVGQTTHLAARMEQIATPGSTLVTSATARLVEGRVRVRPRESIVVKGLPHPVDVCELLGAAPVRTRFAAAAGRGLSRFVGREAELSALDTAWSRVEFGQGEVIALVGEPGVGKSRLLWEFLHGERLRGATVLTGAATAFGGATPHLPIVELLRSYFDVQDGDDAERVQAAITARVTTLDPSLGEALPALFALFDVLPADSEFRVLDAAQRRRRIIDAVRLVVVRESRVRPVVIALEDLHWADTETQAVVNRLVTGLGGARVLALLTYRPEYQHDWSAKSYYTQLRVDPLSHDAARTLLDHLIGPSAGLESLRRILLARTGGNPFFIEESLRVLLDSGAIVGAPGAYEAARTIEDIEVPPTVQAVIAARVDRLRPTAKRVLECASVIGKDVPFDLLRALADLGEDVLRDALQGLEDAEFLYETATFPTPAYTFKHALTHDVVVEGLLHERRRALHARIVREMERLYAERLPEHFERLAEHATRGQAWREAVTYARRAGARAFARCAHRSAAAWFERAVSAAAALPPTTETMETAIDLRLELRAALTPLGEFGRVLETLREAEALASARGDQRRLGVITSYLTNYFQVIGELDRAIDYGTRALAIARRQNDVAGTVVVNAYLSLSYQTIGDYGRAEACARASLDALAASPLTEWFGMAAHPAVYCRTSQVRTFAELGRFVEADAAAAEAIRVGEALDHPYTRMFAHLGLGILEWRRGGFAHAVGALELSLELSRQGDSGVMSALVGAFLGSAYASAGRTDRARPILQDALREADVVGAPLARAVALTGLGEVHLAEGALDRAEAAARAATDACATFGGAGYRAWATHLLGDIHARARPAAASRALECYDAAAEVARRLGMAPLEARCRLGRARIGVASGAEGAAMNELESARQAFHALGMTHWTAVVDGDVAAHAGPQGD
jgi:class 3 adenylate cyclase/tetratricopeptide (TPR) repeat protein